MTRYPHAQEERLLQLIANVQTDLTSVANLFRYIASLLEIEEQQRRALEKRVQALYDAGEALSKAVDSYHSDEGNYSDVYVAMRGWELARSASMESK